MTQKIPDISEKDITKAIRRVLKIIGVYHWKQWQGPMSQPKGVSDIIGITRMRVDELVARGVEEVGVFTAIEVKRRLGKATDDQQKFINRIKNNGGIAFVARSPDDVIDKFGVRNLFF